MKPVTLLKELALAESRRKYPSLPEYARSTHSYTDKNANGLTRMIIDWLRFNGHQAERISVTGRCIDHTEIVTDVVGGMRRIGSGKYIPPTMTPGTSDISATINGRSVKIEVKIGRDKQSPAQKRYQEQIENAGGKYCIARTFDGFIEWYREFIKTECHV